MFPAQRSLHIHVQVFCKTHTNWNCIITHTSNSRFSLQEHVVWLILLNSALLVAFGMCYAPIAGLHWLLPPPSSPVYLPYQLGHFTAVAISLWELVRRPFHAFHIPNGCVSFSAGYCDLAGSGVHLCGLCCGFFVHHGVLCILPPPLPWSVLCFDWCVGGCMYVCVQCVHVYVAFFFSLSVPVCEF